MSFALAVLEMSQPLVQSVEERLRADCVWPNDRHALLQMLEQTPKKCRMAPCKRGAATAFQKRERRVGRETGRIQGVSVSLLRGFEHSTKNVRETRKRVTSDGLVGRKRKAGKANRIMQKPPQVFFFR